MSTLRVALRNSREAIDGLHKLPTLAFAQRESEPRAYAVADCYLRSTGYSFQLETFKTFVEAVQNQAALEMAEIWSVQGLILFALLEQIGCIASECTVRNRWVAKGKSPEDSAAARRLSLLHDSLQRVMDLEWKKVFEEINRTDKILRQDPVGTYAQMDFESREMYRAALSELAQSSSWSETAIASRAIQFARAAHNLGTMDQKAVASRAHVGYYLLDDGRAEIEAAIGYWPSASSRMRRFVLEKPECFYFVCIALGTLAAMAVLNKLLHFGIFPIIAALMFLLSVDVAVSAVNFFVTILVPPKRVPKLDFSKGIPTDHASVVAVPALLISEAQTKKMVRDLEIRYLANQDRNLYFALLTDPPDSVTPVDEKDNLATLCARLIQDLNRKYAADGKGRFLLFHRSRTYNATERIWMGWERKRGKLLQFNNLLLGRGDSFPMKIGDLSVLNRIKYVITLDLDTRLPRGSAHRLVGSMAHPLNRPIVDPATNTVVKGHGILQPRINISLESANRSRLAAIFSGDTGFDIYTRAVSDVYQDLFGEGTFAGKGIYEVSTFQQVLERRFPCNAVLSHDLIEGAHVRAGLVSDVEVVDDYPSRLSTLSRRKHRWTRGDWQIIPWLFGFVRNASGKRVRNPLNTISRWKIFDNLRRSLMECGIFLLLMFGWLDPSVHALAWTLTALGFMAFPAYSRILIGLVRAGGARYTATFWKASASDFADANITLLFRITFLCYESLVAIDAILRTIIRLTFTHANLLEWETSAEAELFSKRSALHAYLDLAPFVSMALWLAVALSRPASLLVATPVLALCGASRPIGAWLSLPSRRDGGIPEKDRDTLRKVSLRTWRFFRVHSNEGENWLIPDVVQADPFKIGHRVSTTDLGLLLNARLAAHDLGFLTVSEFILDTERTLESMSKMARFKGHLYNWYDTRTLEPMRPLFVSTVDNGNLLCSLWTLKQGCLEMLALPLFRRTLWEGIQSHIALIRESVAEENGDHEAIAALERIHRQVAALFLGSDSPDLSDLDGFRSEIEATRKKSTEYDFSDETKWWLEELSARVSNVCRMVRDFAPWKLPQFAKLRDIARLDSLICTSGMTLESAPGRLREMDATLAVLLQGGYLEADVKWQVYALREALDKSLHHYRQASARLSAIAERTNALANEMDFAVLYNPAKKLLSIGYDGETQKLSTYHYDLLASEARVAAFAAIAKGDISQDSWLQLERPQTLYKDAHVLMSWSGTMFEYLMPSLWMRCYKKTMLHKAARTAIHLQQKFVMGKSIPWGISESACSQISNDGEYIYHAFGIPGLALNRDDHSGDIVISPYSTFLACGVDQTGAVRNIRKMRSLGWLGPYGFYDAVDCTPSRVKPDRFKIVPTWMAHHQGMSLISVANVLCDSQMQRRFHEEPMVAASECLLQEKISAPLTTNPWHFSRRSWRLLKGKARFLYPASVTPTEIYAARTQD